MKSVANSPLVAELKRRLSAGQAAPTPDAGEREEPAVRKPVVMGDDEHFRRVMDDPSAWSGVGVSSNNPAGSILPS